MKPVKARNGWSGWKKPDEAASIQTSDRGKSKRKSVCAARFNKDSVADTEQEQACAGAEVFGPEPMWQDFGFAEGLMPMAQAPLAQQETDKQQDVVPVRALRDNTPGANPNMSATSRNQAFRRRDIDLSYHIRWHGTGTPRSALGPARGSRPSRD